MEYATKVFTFLKSHGLGSPGRFTLGQLVCLAIGCFPCVFQLLGNVFLGKAVSFRCAPPSNESSLMSHYAVDNADVQIVYEKCEILVRSNTTVLSRMECVYGIQYDHPRDTSVISQFDLVCFKSALFHLTQTLVIGGQGLGAIVATMLADKFGRRVITVVSNFGLLVTGLAAAFAPNYVIFTIAKLLTGAFQQAYLSGSMTLSMEMVTAKNRRWSIIIEGVKWVSGVMSLALVAFLLRHQTWRVLQVALSLTAMPAFFQLWYIRESLRWLSANGRTEAVDKYIRHATRVNGKNYDDVIQVFTDDVSLVSKDVENIQLTKDDVAPLKRKETVVAISSTSRKLTLIDIVRVRVLLINLLVMGYAWFTGVFGFFALYLVSKPVVGDPFLNFFLNGAMEVPSLVFIFFAVNRIGRKKTLIVLFSVQSFGLLATGVFRSLSESYETAVLAYVGSLIGIFGSGGIIRLLLNFSLELFPTNIRNQALGVCSFIGRVGGMIAPFMTLMAQHTEWGPGVIIGSLSFVVAFLLQFLPETTGRELPQTLEDLQNWRKEDNKKNAQKSDR